MKTKQYTIRGVSERLDGVVREQAEKYDTSLNRLLLEALKRGLGEGEAPAVFHDMDDLAGTWVEDDVFDEVVSVFRNIDVDLWR